MEKLIRTGFSMVILLTVLFNSGCNPRFQSETPAAPQPDNPNLTPTQCTGWLCNLEGTLYREEALPGREIAGQLVELQQISWCSPTAGEQEVVSGQNGSFSFDVYLHDTDSFVLTVNAAGYRESRIKFGGFDCLYCSCPPLEIVLLPE